jgi:hypothetical protein
MCRALFCSSSGGNVRGEVRKCFPILLPPNNFT